MSTSDAKADVLCCVAGTTDDGLMSDPIPQSAGTRSILTQVDVWLTQDIKPRLLTGSTQSFHEYPGMDLKLSGLPR